MATEVAAQEFTTTTAIKEVLKNARAHGSLVRGLHEVAKTLESGNSKLVFLSESCNEPAYKKLIQALAKEKGVPLVMVADKKELGEWAGLCKIDKDGNPRKVVGASSVVITNFGDENSAALAALKKSLGEN
jgi:small subunit ribosomal protein S12e